MSLRFICPHCRVSVDPAAMELSQSDSGEFRVCPHCDTPVLLGARSDPVAQHPDPGGRCPAVGIRSRERRHQSARFK